jgi:hypothetical protein
MAAICMGVGNAAAADDPWRAVVTKPFPEREVSAGADVTGHDWSAYSSFTSTFGGDIRSDGWRWRFTSGYGQYSYTSSRWTGTTVVRVPFDGTVVFADALLGYQKSYRFLTAKLFLGVSALDHTITPFDIENTVQGTQWGAKAVLETWWTITHRSFAQLDVSYATAFQSYAGRARLGYRLWPALSAGVEAGIAGNEAYDAGRGGAFLRYEWPAGEVSVSAGAAGDRASISGGYGTLNMAVRF